MMQRLENLNKYLLKNHYLWVEIKENEILIWLHAPGNFPILIHTFTKLLTFESLPDKDLLRLVPQQYKSSKYIWYIYKHIGCPLPKYIQSAQKVSVVTETNEKYDCKTSSGDSLVLYKIWTTYLIFTDLADLKRYLTKLVADNYSECQKLINDTN